VNSLGRGWLVVGILALGCSNYSPPRTVPAGRIRQGLIVSYLLPSYTMRVGLGERVDFGFRVPFPPGVDVKVNPIRGEFDLALNPGYQYFVPLYGGCAARDPPICNFPPGVHLLRLPVQWGVNEDPDVSLIGEVGPVLVAASDRDAGVLYQAAIGGTTRWRRLQVNPMVQLSFDPSRTLPHYYSSGWQWLLIFGASVTWGVGYKQEY
jgi:hypothetical protein